MANQDILYRIWIKDNKPIKEVTLRDIEKFASENKEKLKSKSGRITPSGFDYAVLKFILEYCSPVDWPTGMWESFEQAKHNTKGNYSIWKKPVNLELKVNIKTANTVGSIQEGEDNAQVESNNNSRRTGDTISRSEFLDDDMSIFCKFIIDEVERRSIFGKKGWLEHLESYRWDGGSLKEGVGIRRNFNGIVTCAADSTRRGSELFKQGVCNAIAGWGKIPEKVSDDDSIQIFKSVNYLRENIKSKTGIISHGSIFGRRIATSSKVYYFSDPWNWTIYDSRVAFALSQLAYLFSRSNTEVFNRIRNRIEFPIPPSQSKDREHPFEVEFREENASLWFVRASILLKTIADYLNKGFQQPSEKIDSSDTWSLYHAEMVFFMLGEKRWYNQPDL